MALALLEPGPASGGFLVVAEIALYYGVVLLDPLKTCVCILPLLRVRP